MENLPENAGDAAVVPTDTPTTSQGGTLTTFHPFLSLPVEIQEMIWRHGWARRTICVRLYRKVKAPLFGWPRLHLVWDYAHYETDGKLKSPRLPTSGFVNSVSRRETLRHYAAIVPFTWQPFEPSAEPAAVQQVRVNKNLDIVHFVGWSEERTTDRRQLIGLSHAGLSHLAHLSVDRSFLRSDLYRLLRGRYGRCHGRTFERPPQNRHRCVTDLMNEFVDLVHAGARSLRTVDMQLKIRDYGEQYKPGARRDLPTAFLEPRAGPLARHPPPTASASVTNGFVTPTSPPDKVLTKLRFVRCCRGDEHSYGGNGDELPTTGLHAVLWDDAPRYRHGWAIFGVVPEPELDPAGVRWVAEWRASNPVHEWLTVRPDGWRYGWGDDLATDFQLVWWNNCECDYRLFRSVLQPGDHHYSEYLNGRSPLSTHHGICSEHFGYYGP